VSRAPYFFQMPSSIAERAVMKPILIYAALLQQGVQIPHH